MESLGYSNDQPFNVPYCEKKGEVVEAKVNELEFTWKDGQVFNESAQYSFRVQLANNKLIKCSGCNKVYLANTIGTINEIVFPSKMICPRCRELILTKQTSNQSSSEYPLLIDFKQLLVQNGKAIVSAPSLLISMRLKKTVGYHGPSWSVVLVCLTNRVIRILDHQQKVLGNLELDNLSMRSASHTEIVIRDAKGTHFTLNAGSSKAIHWFKSKLLTQACYSQCHLEKKLDLLDNKPVLTTTVKESKSKPKLFSRMRLGNFIKKKPSPDQSETTAQSKTRAQVPISPLFDQSKHKTVHLSLNKLSTRSLPNMKLHYKQNVTPNNHQSSRMSRVTVATTCTTSTASSVEDTPRTPSIELGLDFLFSPDSPKKHPPVPDKFFHPDLTSFPKHHISSLNDVTLLLDLFPAPPPRH